MMVFCPQHPKRDQNLQFTPLSETTIIPALSYGSVGVDNTNSMIGRNNNSSASWCRQRNPYIFVSGFPCHLTHIAAGNGHDAFAKVTGEKIEHLHKDLFYWFEKRHIARVFGVLWTRLRKNIKARVNKL